MDDLYEKDAAIFKALGHPTRLQIVINLCKNGCNVNHMVSHLGIPQATVSQHLGVLRNSGIIKGEKKGLEICYRVVNDNVKKIIDILDDKNK